MNPEGNEQGTIRYIRCPSCGSMNPATAPNCLRCGKAQNTAAPSTPVTPAASSPLLRGSGASTIAQVLCPKCHKSFPVGSKFCGYCGTPLPAAAPPITAPPVPVQQPVAPPRPIAPPP